MVAKTTTEIERVRYWQGQLLALADLQTQLLVDEELRRLHNCAVHQAYGIAVGLGVSEPPVTIKDGAIILPCGLAYDCAGRVLIVQEERTIPLLTPVTDKVTLVLSYDPTNVDGIALTWKSARDVNEKTGVAITRLVLDGNNPKKDPDFRPTVARPFARPRVATGITVPGGTAWKPWKIEAEAGTEEIGVQVVVDTSAEGFTQTPHYFAEVIAGSPTPDFVPAWFASISDPSTGGFTLQLLLRRITRESFDIVDPKVEVSALTTTDSLTTVPLDAGKTLAVGDFVARVLPIAEQASLIQTITTAGVAMVDFPIGGLTTPKQIALGNPPRIAIVKEPPDPARVFFETTVTPSASVTFSEQDIVLKLGAATGTTSAAKVVSVDEDENGEVTMELGPPPIGGLASDNKLGKLKPGPDVVQVDPADPKRITVSSLDALALGVTVVLLDVTAVEHSVWTTVTSTETDAGGAKKVVLAEGLPGLNNTSTLHVATEAGVVESATTLPATTKVKLEDDDDHSRVRQFRAGDVVAKKASGGSFAQPVLVKSRTINSSTLTLNGSITGLKKGDTIGAADFRVRATVLEPPIVSQSGTPVTTVKVADPAVFNLPNAFVARIDSSMKASVPLPVTGLPGPKTLQLGGAIENLQAGEVIGLCVFPVTVHIEDIQIDGSIVLSDIGSLRAFDIVMAQHDLSLPTGLAIVKEVAGNVIRLAGNIPGLTANKDLSVANIRGVVKAEVSDASNPVKVKILPPAEPVRGGDFLADITGWLQPRSGESTTAPVKTISGNQITLSAPIDGILKNDVIGMASLTLPQFQIRLNTMPDLKSDDEVLLVGEDRLRGRARSMYAAVKNFDIPTKLVRLEPKDSPAAFTFRPEDISASVLFVRGRVLDLIKKQDLYVSWLATGESDPMPRPCKGAVASDCPCSEVKE